MRTSGNTILITGGGSGIGRGLAEAFHGLGNRVIIAGRRQSALDATVAANPGMAAAVLDIEDRDAIRRFAARIAADHPGLNVLINNAGTMQNEDLLSPEDGLAAMEATVAINLLGPMRLTAALMPHLRRQPHAAIMTVSSGLAFVPLVLTPTYSATKAAIHSYTQSLRYQLKDTAIQVLELVPPYVQTELQGPRQASDPMAMPFKDFIAEAMKIITSSPDVTEICVARVKPQRLAEASGAYDAFFKTMNDRIVAARSGWERR